MAARLVLVVAAVIVWTGVTQAQSNKAPLILVDLVVMNDGYGLAEREKYDAIATPIAARYGVRRMASFDVVRILTDTNLKVARVDLWQVPAPGALNQWAKDPDYVALTPFRDKIHNMKRLPLYFASPAGPLGPRGDGYFLFEFQTFGAGFERDLYGKYERRSLEVAANHGVRQIAAFNILKKINGDGPDTQRLNVWAFTGAEQFKAWNNSAEFKSLAPVRQRLFDLPRFLFLIAAKAKN